jgi:hypothetical protein
MADDRTGVRTARLVGAASAIALALVLSACTAPTPSSAPSPSPSASATRAPVDEPAPVLDPAGDATANLDFFDATNQALIESTPAPNGQQIVDNLVAAGFTKTDMEVTPDVTVGKEAAETIQFSVRINGTCLIGQTGAAGYNAIAAPLLGTGKCLVGTTRTIDW